uniref:Uncharacterized protein n=1 Tax=viral metagenome TaxID=1070528 RepID=A0A6C0JE43_9ZZZZ
MDLKEGTIHWKKDDNDNLFLGTYTSKNKGPYDEENGWKKYTKDSNNKAEIVSFLKDRLSNDAIESAPLLAELKEREQEFEDDKDKAERLGGKRKGKYTKRRTSKKNRTTRKNRI